MEINTIINSDCLEGLKQLPSESIDCCVTSPPYYGLRDYGTAQWTGGNPECLHSLREEKGFENYKQSTNRGNSKPPKNVCPKCGAIRVDEQIVLEETPEVYIERLSKIFEEIFRVLKNTGTLWLNIGDSYWGGKGYSGSSAGIYQYERRQAGKSITPECSNFGGKGTIRPTDRKHEYIKAKDLIGIPWMLAFELRRTGWYLRQDVVWHKPNPMPESVKDRCTKSHEYLFLLAKSSKYYFNYRAIQEKSIWYDMDNRSHTGPTQSKKSKNAEYQCTKQGVYQSDGMRNKRDVWTVCTESEKEAHFACFPQKLIMDCIKAGCPEGGIVLDPFMGSGTTAVVARKLNRNYIGFELNPDYVAIANRKLYRELGMFL
ncbi:MAG: site-specific DNA-methyltransferase [Prevotellaceae bacterium]|jgi:DNA modification methylase|nr:site-specific DNA-methyltransferase [Prevotellaceae bacterium]